ncbi:MAG: ATP-binding protein [Paludibacteraceae bacterium]|nr:ATP-binding protein [Paludibacteraceae bacterium]
MDIELLKRIIVTNRRKISEISVVNREYLLDANMNYIFTGVRQSGKTFLMFQRIQELLRQGVDLKTIVYINFDDERLIGFSSEDFDLLLQTHYQMDERPPILFLDEIQNVPFWEKFARRIANEKYRVYITGSNAKMLSSEFATVLGGRYQIVNVYPYSFREFLNVNKIALENDWEYDDKIINSIRRCLDIYFNNGGFPDCLTAIQKRNWLSSLFKKMLLGDIVARYSVKNVNALTYIVKKLSESIKQPISYTRLTQLVSSLGAKIQVNTLIDYLSYLEESWVLLSVKNFASRFVEREGNKKYYFCDNGILNLFLVDGNTSLLENIVAVNLKRMYGEDVYFYRKNVEVDFYLPMQSALVQVSYSIDDEETKRRETESLVKIANFLDAKTLMIITMNEENIIELCGRQIKVIPLWKWLLKIL